MRTSKSSWETVLWALEWFQSALIFKYAELTPGIVELFIKHAQHVVLSWMYYFRVHHEIPAGIALFIRGDD
jgi:hypothetical protein